MSALLSCSKRSPQSDSEANSPQEHKVVRDVASEADAGLLAILIILDNKVLDGATPQVQVFAKTIPANATPTLSALVNAAELE